MKYNFIVMVSLPLGTPTLGGVFPTEKEARSFSFLIDYGLPHVKTLEIKRKSADKKYRYISPLFADEYNRFYKLNHRKGKL